MDDQKIEGLFDSILFALLKDVTIEYDARKKKWVASLLDGNGDEIIGESASLSLAVSRCRRNYKKFVSEKPPVSVKG